MSLEDLLSDADSSSSWRNQKKKLLRIIFGLLIIAVVSIIGTVLLFSLKESRLSKNKIATEKRELEVKSLAQLMRLQKEAKDLQLKVSELKGNSGESRSPSSVGQSHTFHGRKDDSTARIINYDPGEGFTKLKLQKDDLYIPTGAVFRARLITPIKTSVEKTFVLAETTHEYRMDMKRKIPKGSRLIGRSRLNPILKGVIVEFDTLVLPNGIETSISGLALSRNALPEIDGLYFSNDLQNYGAALAFGFLSGFSDAAVEREPTLIGPVATDTVSNRVLSGLSTASFQVAENIMEDIRTKAIEYVVVPAGEPVFVALTRRYNLNQGSLK